MPVAVQGASSRMAPNGAGGLPLQRVGDDDLGVHRQPAKVAHQELRSLGRALQCRHPRTHGGELRRLAARCGADVEHAPVLDLAQQHRRQGGGGVLHPPGALVVARQGVDQAAAAPAQRAGGQDLGPQLVGPALGIARDGEVERRLALMRLGDRPRLVLAIGRGPAVPQPFGRVQPRRVLALQQLAALGRQLAQHRVEHRDLAAEAAGGEAHRLGHRGVRRGRQEQELGGTQPQQVGDRQLLGPIAQERQGGVVDLAQAAQHGGDQEAREGPVADGELGQLRVALEGLVERAMVGAEHAVEDVERHMPRVGADRSAEIALRLDRDRRRGRRRGLGEAGLAPGEAATLAARRSAPVRRALGHAASASRRRALSIRVRVSAVP